jgi:molybdate transport system substrate-binding protein
VRRLLLAGAATLLTACGASSAAAPPPATPGSVSGVITVFAAASLTAAFNAEGAAFHAAHPQATVRFNFAGSAALATQIDQGAPADVFASADTANLQKVVAAGNAVGQPVTFATNLLEIVVGPGNPKRLTGLSDLGRPGLAVVLCAPVVPCGHYALQALSEAGASVTPKSQEQDVDGVLSKVELGEADAGIVYVTDVKAAGAKVSGVPIPSSQNVVASYPVAAVKGGTNLSGGQAFIDFLLSPTGQRILASYGFAKA